LIVEIIVLLLAVAFIYTVMRVEQSGKLVIDEDSIIINEAVREYADEVLGDYLNVALFGVDSTTGSLGRGTRADGIIIASLNRSSGDIRLVSVYRDTYLNLGNDRYNKCNAAYAQGGPEQAINMLNMNLDLNITDFITIGFKGMSEAIDTLGGIMIEITEAELLHINNYQMTMAEDLGRGYVPIERAGLQRIDGLQATAYCRIRFTAGDDFRRAERQRDVLRAILDEAKKASPATLTRVADDIFSSVLTSFELSMIMSLLLDITKYDIVGDSGFPAADLRTTATIGSSGSCVVPLDLEQNAIWLHDFLFGEQYVPSTELRAYSKKIKEDTSPYLR
jgi:LCP family protein required for cell wall assembly